MTSKSLVAKLKKAARRRPFFLCKKNGGGSFSKRAKVTLFEGTEKNIGLMKTQSTG